MTARTSCESLPPELWFTIMEKLPLKSQVSLACTCKTLYKLSLDPFLDNIHQRTWLYLEANKPVPDLLAKAVTILRIPAVQDASQDIKSQSRFLQKEISRMSNLRMLILEKTPHQDAYLLSATATCELIQQLDLDELKVPEAYLTRRSPRGKTLLHLAVAKGNTKLVDCLLSQMAVYFEQESPGWGAAKFSEELNAPDGEGYNPLKIAIKQGNEELIILLLKTGARDKRYLLSKKKKLLSPIIQGRIDKGHLHVKYLSPLTFEAFFEAVAESRLMSLSFSAEFHGTLKKKRLAFFQHLAEALRKNFSKSSSALPEKEENSEKNFGLLLLDLRELENLVISEVKPFFTCPGLKELLLPRSLIDHLDACNQNLLHLLVQERSPNLGKEIAASFIAQGVALTARDRQGLTPAQLAQRLELQTGNQEMAVFLEQAAKRKLNAIIFGKKDWEKYYGKVGQEPPLPSHVLEILESPCPFWPGERVQGTHVLTLIPRKVNGKPLTLDYLENLVKNPKEGGHKTGYACYWDAIKQEHGSKPSGSSYWVLMTKDILPNTRTPLYGEQLTKLNILAARAPETYGQGPYRPPKALEAATSILMEYVRSGIRLYSRSKVVTNQFTFTSCEETVLERKSRVIVGGFAAHGLFFALDDWGDNSCGLDSVRRCFDP